MSARTDIEAGVRGAYAQFAEKDARHRVVIVLAGMDKSFGNFGFTVDQSPQGRSLDELGPGPDDGRDP
jgi:hypothetical protein